MAGGLASFWEQWNIQILVILSFALQVILLSCAGIRRRKASALSTISLWLAYLMADYTAIYALGHMSISTSRSPPPPRGRRRMAPFWAPFLLLHLGGPDTITAYAFQDNQLWLRHLLTLAGQVLGAVYVIYLFAAADRNPMLLAATALMFVSGCLKYGERTWALKRGGIDSIAGSLDDGGKPWAAGGPYQGREGQELDSEEVLLGAHYMLNFCKGLLADGPVMQASEYEAVRQGIQLNGGKYLFELAAMELSLLYDVLYTKAAVIHTWHGYCVRVVSPLAAVAAFVLFQLSSSKGAYGRADVAVTYVLLVGAMALELASSLRAAGSSWACASFHARGWRRLCGAVMRLRRMLKAGARRRACLDSLGQYNLLDLCTDANKDGLRGKVAKMIGLGDRWQKLHYSSAVPVSDGVKALVLGEIRKRRVDDLRNARGRWVLEEKGMYEDLARIADDNELDRSIIVWHIATDLYLSLCPEPEEEGSAGGGTVVVVRDSIRALSNHMLFLMVLHPYLLPGIVRSGRYKENIKYYEMLWWVTLKSTKEGTMKLSRSEIVKKIAEWQVPAAGSTRPQAQHKHVFGVRDEPVDDVDDRPVYADGSWLAGMLLGNRWSLPAAELLEVIAGVWVEMLCYAAHHCGEESHAQKLSTGGEFIDAVWLIVGHATLYDRFAPSAEGLTGGLRLSDNKRGRRKRKRPAATGRQPEAELQSTVGVNRPRQAGVPLPPGVHPAYRPFFDVEAGQTPRT